MEELIGNQWQQWAIIKIALFGIVVFVILRLLQKSLKIIVFRYGLEYAEQRFYPVFELMVWLSFIYWALGEVLSEPLYFSVFFITISMIGMIWIGWYAARDYIAGIILRTQDVYETGHHITVAEINGVIKKIGYLNIELEKEDGTVLKVPYSKISGNIHLNKNENKLVSTFTLKIKVSSVEILNGVSEKIRSHILNSPWHVAHLEPRIYKKDEGAGGIYLE